MWVLLYESLIIIEELEGSSHCFFIDVEAPEDSETFLTTEVVYYDILEEYYEIS